MKGTLTFDENHKSLSYLYLCWASKISLLCACQEQWQDCHDALFVSKQVNSERTHQYKVLRANSVLHSVFLSPTQTGPAQGIC